MCVIQRKRDDNKNKICVFQGGGWAGGQAGKIVQNAIFHGKRHDNKILKVNILLSTNFVVMAQAPSNGITKEKGSKELFCNHFGQDGKPQKWAVSSFKTRSLGPKGWGPASSKLSGDFHIGKSKTCPPSSFFGVARLWEEPVYKLRSLY